MEKWLAQSQRESGWLRLTPPLQDLLLGGVLSSSCLQSSSPTRALREAQDRVAAGAAKVMDGDVDNVDDENGIDNRTTSGRPSTRWAKPSSSNSSFCEFFESF